MKRLLRRKNIDDMLDGSAAKTGHGLKKALSSFDVTMIGIGAIIGAGIFAMVGEGVLGGSSGYPAGPALVLSFLLTAIACGFAALCYAEFAAMAPVSGSAYTYAYATLGEFAAWIIGWDLILEYAIGNIAVAISWAGYFNEFIKAVTGLDIPVWLRLDYRTFIQKGYEMSQAPHIFGIPVVFNLPAVAIVFVITALLVTGIKESSKFNNILVAVKIGILLLFVGLGFYYFKPEHWTPFAPGGWKGIKTGASLIFFAYIGFDAVSTVAEETKNPQKDMPRGIIGSLLICTVIYIFVTLALTGMIPFPQLKEKIAEPLVAALLYNNAPTWTVIFVALGAIVATTAVLLVFQMGQPRIFYAMSRDGLLPKAFARVHPKFKTPFFSTIVTGIIVAVPAAFCHLDEMANLCNIGTLFAFVVVCAAVIVLRIKEPNRHRPFKVPFGFLFPLLGMAMCFFLMTGLDSVTWLRFMLWLAIGLVIYFFYGVKRSGLAQAKNTH